MKSERQNSKFWRFAYRKNSGIIIFAPIIIVAIIGYVYMVSSQDFYSAWSCETLVDYTLDKDVPDKFPSHSELDEEQHLKLHQLLQECSDSDRFAAPINHT